MAEMKLIFGIVLCGKKLVYFSLLSIKLWMSLCIGLLNLQRGVTHVVEVTAGGWWRINAFSCVKRAHLENKSQTYKLEPKFTQKVVNTEGSSIQWKKFCGLSNKPVRWSRECQTLNCMQCVCCWNITTLLGIEAFVKIDPKGMYNLHGHLIAIWIFSGFTCVSLIAQRFSLNPLVVGGTRTCILPCR